MLVFSNIFLNLLLLLNFKINFLFIIFTLNGYYRLNVLVGKSFLTTFGFMGKLKIKFIIIIKSKIEAYIIVGITYIANKLGYSLR